MGVMIDDAHRPAGHPPSGVALRMERLRVLCVPERDAEARRRLADRPRTTPFAAAVARRLAELRALCDLALHLRRR
jgi:hypothetical protein